MSKQIYEQQTPAASQSHTSRLVGQAKIQQLDKMLKEIKRLEELKQRYERVRNSWGKSV